MDSLKKELNERKTLTIKFISFLQEIDDDKAKPVLETFYNEHIDICTAYYVVLLNNDDKREKLSKILSKVELETFLKENKEYKEEFKYIFGVVLKEITEKTEVLQLMSEQNDKMRRKILEKKNFKSTERQQLSPTSSVTVTKKVNKKRIEPVKQVTKNMIIDSSDEEEEEEVKEKEKDKKVETIKENQNSKPIKKKSTSRITSFFTKK